MIKNRFLLLAAAMTFLMGPVWGMDPDHDYPPLAAYKQLLRQEDPNFPGFQQAVINPEHRYYASYINGRIAPCISWPQEHKTAFNKLRTDPNHISYWRKYFMDLDQNPSKIPEGMSFKQANAIGNFIGSDQLTNEVRQILQTIQPASPCYLPVVYVLETHPDYDKVSLENPNHPKYLEQAWKNSAHPLYWELAKRHNHHPGHNAKQPEATALDHQRAQQEQRHQTILHCQQNIALHEHNLNQTLMLLKETTNVLRQLNVESK